MDDLPFDRCESILPGTPPLNNPHSQFKAPLGPLAWAKQNTEVHRP
jgi:hypothetical protein